MATVTGQSGQAHTSGAAGGASGRMDVFGQWTLAGDWMVQALGQQHLGPPPGRPGKGPARDVDDLSGQRVC